MCYTTIVSTTCQGSRHPYISIKTHLSSTLEESDTFVRKQAREFMINYSIIDPRYEDITDIKFQKLLERVYDQDYVYCDNHLENPGFGVEVIQCNCSRL